jgi:hypothetical protein
VLQYSQDQLRTGTCDLEQPISCRWKNTNSWHARKGDLQRAFSLDIPMVISSKLSFIANGNNLTSVGLTPGKTICFGSLELTADRFGCLTLC